VPTVSPVQNADVQGAIARAATRTGVDFDYLLAQARLESGLDPSAKAQTSSASGLYQFIDSTWLRTLDRHGAKHGMDWADAAIAPNGRVADTATRQQLLSLRYDADASSLMAAELTRENAAGLRSSLGRDAEPAELYLAHFLGLGGAQKFLGALGSDPEQSAAALMPQAARANRSIFYNGGSPRSVGEVMTDERIAHRQRDVEAGRVACREIVGGHAQHQPAQPRQPCAARPARIRGGPPVDGRHAAQHLWRRRRRHRPRE